MLGYNLRDNVNSYIMKEDGTYEVKKSNNKTSFNIHKEFVSVTLEKDQKYTFYLYDIDKDELSLPIKSSGTNYYNIEELHWDKSFYYYLIKNRDTDSYNLIFKDSTTEKELFLFDFEDYPEAYNALRGAEIKIKSFSFDDKGFYLFVDEKTCRTFTSGGVGPVLHTESIYSFDLDYKFISKIEVQQ